MFHVKHGWANLDGLAHPHVWLMAGRRLADWLRAP